MKLSSNVQKSVVVARTRISQMRDDGTKFAVETSDDGVAWAVQAIYPTREEAREAAFARAWGSPG